MKRCPSCFGQLRKGAGERALYRSGKHVGIGVVCPRCIKRSIRVVLGSGIVAPGARKLPNLLEDP